MYIKKKCNNEQKKVNKTKTIIIVIVNLLGKKTNKRIKTKNVAAIQLNNVHWNINCNSK